MAMVWIALLGGGDYAPEGLTGFGKFFQLEVNLGDAEYRVYEEIHGYVGRGLRHLQTLWIGLSGKFGLYGIGERRILCM
jgi:hypothetical protein